MIILEKKLARCYLSITWLE